MELIWKKLMKTGLDNIYTRDELKQLGQQLFQEREPHFQLNDDDFNCCGPDCDENFANNLNTPFYYDSCKWYAIYCSNCFHKRNFDKHLERPFDCNHDFFLRDSDERDCSKMTVHKGSYQLNDNLDLCLNHMKMIQNLLIQVKFSQTKCKTKCKSKSKEQERQQFILPIKNIIERLKSAKLIKLELKMFKEIPVDFSIYWKNSFPCQNNFFMSTKPKGLEFPNGFNKFHGWIEKLEDISNSWFVGWKKDDNHQYKNKIKFDPQEIKSNREKFITHVIEQDDSFLQKSKYLLECYSTINSIWDYFYGSYDKTFEDINIQFGSIRSWLPFEYQEFKFKFENKEDGNKIDLNNFKQMYPKFVNSINNIKSSMFKFRSYDYHNLESFQIWLLVNCEINSSYYSQIKLALLARNINSAGCESSLEIYHLDLTPIQFAMIQLKSYPLLSYESFNHELFSNCNLFQMINNYYAESKIQDILEELALHMQ